MNCYISYRRFFFNQHGVGIATSAGVSIFDRYFSTPVS